MRWLLFSLSLLFTSSARPTKEALCSYGTSNYSLSWVYDDLSNDVVFRLTATSEARNFWTGVYFGSEEPFDAIGIFVRNGQFGIVDAHIPVGDEATVVADDLTNVQSLSFDMVEGRLTAEFARPLTSGDSHDTDLAKCSTFFFPEAEEITRTGQITLPTMSMSRKVCDITRNCPARKTARKELETVKREESPAEVPTSSVAPEVAPVIEAEPVASLESASVDASPVEEKKESPVCSVDKDGVTTSWKIQGDNVIFTVEQDAKKGKWYSVFGVGQTMDDIRTLIAFTEGGKLKKAGAFKTEGHGDPVDLEFEPTIGEAPASENKIAFTLTAEKAKLFGEADLSGCVTLQIGASIGQYGKGFKVKKHKSLPEAVEVCSIEKCGLPVEKTETVEGSGSEVVEGSGEEQQNQEGLLFNPFKATESTTTVVPVTEAVVLSSTQTPSTTEEKKEEEKEPVATPAPEELAQPEKTVSETQSIEEQKDGEVKSTAAPKGEEVVEGSGDAPPPVPSTTAKEATAAATSESKDDLLIVVSSPKPNLDEELAKEAAATTVIPAINGECSPEHKDLKVCASYFTDYIGKVEEWASNHEQTVGSQMWKACTLLSEVKHVPSMCCNLYRETCSAHIKL